MTLPEQSDRAVAQTREFLVRLASPYVEGGIKGIRREVRAEALALLRHYPYAWLSQKCDCPAPDNAARQDILTGDTPAAHTTLGEGTSQGVCTPTDAVPSQPFAWAADIPGKFGAAPTVLFGYTETLVRRIAAAGGDLVQPFPLYRTPQTCPHVVGRTTLHCSLTPFTLTAEEREAVEFFSAMEWPKESQQIRARSATLRGLLERLD
jgi:hypothetical protein